MRFKVLISYKGGDDWINESVAKQKKRKRKYLILEWIKDIKDPVKWAREHIAHFNTTLPKHRHRRFEFVRVVDRKENVK